MRGFNNGKTKQYNMLVSIIATADIHQQNLTSDSKNLRGNLRQTLHIARSITTRYNNANHDKFKRQARNQLLLFVEERFMSE